MNRLVAVIPGFFPLLFLTACGRAATAPAPLSSPTPIDLPIAVVFLENQTTEPIVAKQITSLLQETLIRRRLNIVPHPQGAAFVLSGAINLFDKVPIALDLFGKVSRYRLTVGLSYRLLQAGETVVLQWRDTAYADWERPSDLSLEKPAQDRALREIAWNLSQSAAQTLLEFLSTNHSPPSPRQI